MLLLLLLSRSCFLTAETVVAAAAGSQGWQRYVLFARVVVTVVVDADIPSLLGAAPRPAAPAT